MLTFSFKRTSNSYLNCYNYVMSIEDLKEMFAVSYSDKQPQRGAEEQAWIHFADFLDECAGITFIVPCKG